MELLLSFGQRLFPRLVVPIFVMGAILAGAVLLVTWVLEKRLEKRELLSQAEIVISALEASAPLFGSAFELVEFIQSVGAETSGLRQIALVEEDAHQIIAATAQTWIARPAADVPYVAPVLSSTEWDGFEANEVVFALPVDLANSPLAKVYGNQLLAVVVLDGDQLASFRADHMQVLFTLAAAGAAALFVGFFVVIRTKVLVPLHRLHEAIEANQGSGSQEFPVLHEDEIGGLAKVLRDSFARVTDADERVWLMGQALENSSNEVYVIEPRTMDIRYVNPAAARNLGYSKETLLKMKVPDSAPDMRIPEEVEKLSAQLREKGEISHRYEHIRADGTTYPFEFNAVLVGGEGPSSMLVIGNDISPRIAQENALRESEERLQLALAGSNDGLFDLNLGNGDLYVSDLLSGWLGITRDRISLKDVLDFVDEKQRNQVAAAFRRSVENGSDFNVEFQLSHRAANPMWLSARGQVQFDDGAPVRLSGFASDVTRRKLAEDLLQGTVARLAAVLENIREGIVTLAEDGAICTMNSAALEMCGFEKDEFAGHYLSELLRIDAEDDVIQTLGWVVVADGEPRECIATAFDGRQFAAEISVTQMELLSDERFTVVLRDISERKRHDAQMREAMEEAQAATQAKGEFLATMSHEIRTPMNGVLGMTQLLLDMELSAEQRETAEVIFSSGESLLSLINDILDFSKIEAGKIELESVSFDLRTAIKEVLDLLAANARDKSLDLYVDYPETLPRWFAGDVGRLRQILMNLVGNAIKFTGAGHVLVRVSLEDESERAAHVHVTVEDTGPGVAAEDGDRLFDSFTQADASTTRRYGGTGLGLAICKQLVELMNGEIGVDSDGTGAAFWFSLQLAKSAGHASVAAEDLSRLAGKRVFAVDDNQVGLKIVSGLCGGLGMEVETCGDPHAVEGRVDELYQSGTEIDVFVLDYNMPGIDGLALAAKLRADSRLVDAKIVLLSSSEIRGTNELDGYAVRPVIGSGMSRLLLRALFGDADHDSAESQSPSEHPRQGSVRVLLAEDNVVNQKVAARMLEKLGCRVDVAANGREAVDMWERFPYSVIFMDCQMPELDGLTATRTIRDKETKLSRKHTPIVAMTANAMQQDEEDCLSAGMDDYASKPVKLDLLQQILDKWTPVDAGPH